MIGFLRSVNVRSKREAIYFLPSAGAVIGAAMAALKRVMMEKMTPNRILERKNKSRRYRDFNRLEV